MDGGARRRSADAVCAARLQLTSKEPLTFTDLQRDGARLAAAGVAHGDLVYLLYHFERDVAPAVKKTAFESRPFGAPRCRRGIRSPRHRYKLWDPKPGPSCTLCAPEPRDAAVCTAQVRR